MKRETRIGTSDRFNCNTRSCSSRSVTVMRERWRVYSAQEVMTKRSTKRPSSSRSRKTRQLLAPTQ